MGIQVERNGRLVEVSKRELFVLAKAGKVGPETRIVVNGAESVAGKAKGIEFGSSQDDAEEDIFGISEIPPLPGHSISVQPVSAASATETKYCSACGQLSGNGAFCAACGSPVDPRLATAQLSAEKKGKKSKTGTCPDCEGTISKTATQCPHCGCKLSKSKLTAILISVFIPGLGQIYQRRFFLGIVILGLWLVVCGGICPNWRAGACDAAALVFRRTGHAHGGNQSAPEHVNYRTPFRCISGFCPPDPRRHPSSRFRGEGLLFVKNIY